MREMCVGTKVVPGTAENAWTCDYFILIDEMAVGSGLACESYGLRVRVRESGEEARIPNITVRVAQIDALMELFLRNTVTPATAWDVVEDWLACV